MADIEETTINAERVIRIAARGDGATESGRHIAGVAPGDLVDEHGSIIEKGPHHQSAQCRHYGKCGGCQLQHIDDVAYASFLSDRIVHALAQHDIVADKLHEPHISPAHTRRRVSLRAVRSKTGVSIGFNEGSSHNLVDLKECPVMHPALFDLTIALRVLLSELMPQRSAAAITMTLCDQGVDLLVGPFDADNLKTLERLSNFAQTHALARLSVDSGYGAELIYMAEHPTVTMDGVRVALPPANFLQATVDGEKALIAAVKTITAGAQHVADLFSGLGTFAMPLSRNAHVLAVDAAGVAIEALDMAARQSRRLIKAQHRDLFRAPMDADELNKFDALVVDPPRAGAKAQAENIALSNVPCVAMVSCNPNSFARDAKILIDGGYKLGEVWPVGQFRWSIHTELVAAFYKNA